VAGGGTVTVGSWPKAKSWARRRASSLSVLRFWCLNFQASEAVLATWQGSSSSAQRSWTQPANRQASMTTAAGRGVARRLRRRARSVVRVRKVAAAGSPVERQATDLYLPRSRARMVRAAAVAVVVIVQAPVGRGVAGWCGNSQLTTPPRLAWILSVV